MGIKQKMKDPPKKAPGLKGGEKARRQNDREGFSYLFQ
jgi:hypothetical protein